VCVVCVCVRERERERERERRASTKFEVHICHPKSASRDTTTS
jgi:hypothetical protein